MRKGVQYYRTRILDADGKQVSLYATTCEELYEKQAEAKRQVEEIIFHREHPTVAEYCEKWLLMQSAKVSAATLKGYTSNMNNYIIKPMGDMYMEEVTADDIRLALVPLSKKSAGLYNTVNMLIKCIFYSAERSQLLQHNPCVGISSKGGKPIQKKEALTDQQVKVLLDTVKGLPPQLFVMIGLYSGLRREEAQVGKYRVIVTGKGNFIGTAETTLTITDNAECVAMGSVKVTKKIPDQKLVKGIAEIEEDLITLKYKGERLKPKVDYVFDTSQYYGAGTHYVTIRGIGEKYIGEIVTTFRVQGTKVSALKVDSVVYTGNMIKPIIRDKNGQQLIEGEDYVMHSLTGTESVGTAKITISGKNAYYGTVVKSFRVTPHAIDDTDVSVTFAKAGSMQSYEKNGAKPKLKVTYAGRQLKEGTDYVLSYRNNKKIGNVATVTITGKKNFRSKKDLSFIVGKGSLEDATVIVADKVVSTKVGGYVSTPVLRDTNGSKLAAGKDYDKNIIYKCDGMVLNKKADRLLAGAEVTIEIIGKGNYAGTKTMASYRILAAGKDLSKAKVTVKSKFYYNGDNVILSPEDLIVKIGKITLPADAYQILPETYFNNDRKGTAQVTIQGVGSYGGTKTIRFKINARKVNNSAAG